MSNPGNSQQSFDVADEDFASPRVTKESAPNENKNIKNPKAVQKKKRRASKSKSRPCRLQGLLVYLKYEGIKTLGSICAYDYKTNLFQVEFMLEGKPKRYAKEEEVLHNKATSEQVTAHNAGCISVPKKEEEKSASRKRSTPASEEASSSQKKEKD